MSIIIFSWLNNIDWSIQTIKMIHVFQHLMHSLCWSIGIHLLVSLGKQDKPILLDGICWWSLERSGVCRMCTHEAKMASGLRRFRLAFKARCVWIYINLLYHLLISVCIYGWENVCLRPCLMYIDKSLIDSFL